MPCRDYPDPSTHLSAIITRNHRLIRFYRMKVFRLLKFQILPRLVSFETDMCIKK